MLCCSTRLRSLLTCSALALATRRFGSHGSMGYHLFTCAACKNFSAQSIAFEGGSFEEFLPPFLPHCLYVSLVLQMMLSILPARCTGPWAAAAAPRSSSVCLPCAAPGSWEQGPLNWARARRAWSCLLTLSTSPSTTSATMLTCQRSVTSAVPFCGQQECCTILCHGHSYCASSPELICNFTIL